MAACICPSCGEQQLFSSVRCCACGGELLLRNSYVLRRIIGDNQAITYLALELNGRRRVVVKELAIHRMKTWKEEELFLREMEVLRGTSHPQIPRYLDYFRIDSGKHIIHYLVQEYIRGVNLKTEFASRRYSDSEVVQIAVELLKILVFLQDCNPPLIHRDIKLSNIIRGPDGRISLIDFGSVKEWFRKTVSGDTVAGTFGYMAPEQFYGQGLPQTDIYALGVTMLVLLTHLSPDKMMNERNVLEWRGFVNASRPIIRLLDQFLDPDPLQRPRNAREALVQAECVLEEYRGAEEPGVMRLKTVSSAEGTSTYLPGAWETADPTWARQVRRYKDLPVEYGVHFPVDAKELPYVVLVPEIVKPVHLQRTEKCVSVFSDRLEVLEKRNGRVGKYVFSLDSIVTIEHGEVLLNSWLKLNVDGRHYHIPYNTVNDEVFNPILYMVRRSMFGYTELRYDYEAHEHELMKLDFLQEFGYKYYRRGRKVLLPGSKLLGFLFQPKRTASSTTLKTGLIMLTDSELILLREEDNPRGMEVNRYGMIHRFVPLSKMTGIEFSPRAFRIRFPGGESILLNHEPDPVGLSDFKKAISALTLPLNEIGPL